MSSTIPAHSSQITYPYADHWKHNDTDGTMYTTHAGDTANLTFTGSSIQVYGTLPANINGTIQPVSSFTLDDGSTVMFDAAKFGTQVETSNAIFYQSDLNLSNGSHSLSIRSEKDKAYFILASIVIFSGANPLTGPPLVSPVPLHSSTAATPSSSSSSLSSSSNGIKTNVGGVAGGIIAALAMIAGVFAFILLRRRRNRRIAKSRNLTPYIAEPIRTPLESTNQTWNSYGVSTTQPPQYDTKEPLPETSLGSSSLVRHGSMYKPKTDSDNLPSEEFGYGKGV
ncbi:hypothetical protein F5878DRAFT_628567 [Lentinula raphanica]|uniref:Uncharacterized protein n=1 Tax=Lentinula raphanica TaxID=153919 RepID=A0AA38P2S8_9AGAR|nr:hypothetical protein F5878DRAFT_628567 [Lentinula raphanica]